LPYGGISESAYVEDEPLMPELPEVAAYISALEPRVVGKVFQRISIASIAVLRTTDPPPATLEGKTVRELRRLGKRIAIGCGENLWLVLHLMIAGRLHWRPEGTKLSGRNQLAAFGFTDGTLVLTEAGTKRRAQVHVARGEAALEALDAGGIDVLSATLDQFRAALNAENHTLKRALTDPRVLSGIGNAYSDEILHAARLSPVAQTQKLSDEEWQRLHDATRATLHLWIERLREEARAKFPEHVTAFREDMAVHGRYGKPCPRCGQTVQRIRYADNETNYCANCQTGGKLLADRALSRLLKADWPRSFEALEELRRR
jgi:formamidopyrimidine-DNA glycosylase